MTKEKQAGAKALAFPDLESTATMRAASRWVHMSVQDFLLNITFEQMVEEERAILREEYRLARLEEKLSAIRAVTTHSAEQGNRSAPVLSVPAIAPAPVMQKQRGRRDLLTPLIEEAQRKCEDPWDAAEVWPHLRVMAEASRKPFTGVTESGLGWDDANDERKFFNLKSLRNRLGRARGKTSGNTR